MRTALTSIPAVCQGQLSSLDWQESRLSAAGGGVIIITQIHMSVSNHNRNGSLLISIRKTSFMNA